MLIRSPNDLHYPITVDELSKEPLDDIERGAPLFTYYYETTVTEGDKYGDEKEVKKRYPASFRSSKDGKLSTWFIKKGSVVERAGINLAEIEEPCTHETQFGGMCADCGKDMTEADYITDGRDVDRATVNMTHDNTALLVSKSEALKAEEDAKRRLLGVKKLSLIVDLDQTVIHTTCERTIAEWQNDKDNPNYEAVKEVKSFQLADDKLANVAANWYYCKLRPGLKEFLDKVSEMYELHIYTMATRAYAQAIAKIIDPDRIYFGDRILSRDENGTDQVKTLHRLFPVNTDMVLVIDDRGDIWQWSDNLVKVRAYNFFLGAGDINASFLPKQTGVITEVVEAKVVEPTKVAEKVTESNGEVHAVSIAAKPLESVPAPATNGVISDLEKQLLTMSGGDNPTLLEQQAKEQEKVIISQQTERPLLQKQLALEQAEEIAEAEEDMDDTEVPPPEQHKHKSLLHDDDDELIYIEACLRRVHRAFFDEYQKKRTAHPRGRIAELKGEKSPKKRVPDDMEVVPDVKTIMPRMKRSVLQGVSLVFSGIIPLGIDVQNSDIALWAKSFGAQVFTDITKHTTHVIANPSRKTTKVKKASHHPHIKIVTTEWLLQCFSKWERLGEEPYTIQVDPTEHGPHGGSPTLSPFDDLDEGPLLSAEDDDGALSDEEDDELKSPVTVDISEETWQALGDEFQDFMDESDDDDDDGTGSETESVHSENSVQSSSTTKKSKKKRKRGTESADASETDDSDVSVNSSTGSKLQRKKKRVLERVTSLTNVVTADKSSGLPSPEATGPEEGHEENEGLGEEDDDDDDGAALEAELLAELEREDAE